MNKQFRKGLRKIIIMSLLVSLGGCYYDQIVPDGPPPGAEISFATDIQPIFDNKCNGCHPPAGGLDLTTGNAYEAINKLPYVDVSNPSASTIYTIPAPNASHGNTYSPGEAATVLQWIEQGALNN